MGVTKTIIKEGDKQTYPKPGDSLLMHYVGTFKDNGQVFDSSERAGQPIRFPVGRGQVIRGWDEGVIRMSLGEKAKLEITSDFAYGRQGAPGVIPPYADLVFEVELLAINEKQAPKDLTDQLLSCVCYAGVAVLVLKVCGCL
ncbi:unnamed protein product [Cladocopium goreaui]|uniref:peptidylprolyl isomerase n=1 Tax=Cladocopium goreaui TaxID=2562237 RepID=A0A9P1BKY3_9DINO|nr:unnamed protein product [Cladocopium goreaui]CAI3997205.1 unnamed protein product [Cladocopium goreaui]|mmetsp:Transcript_37575/g.76824  ORF Transcript_37575/g.76824 Transcript_37575/m.76824 type:complete len:142 (+) Transcript_37575:68-493(+)